METLKYKGFTIRYGIDEGSYDDDPTDYDGFTILEMNRQDVDDDGKITADLKAEMKAGKRFLVDRYEHGMSRYTLAGEYRDRWDTSSNWGWIILDDEWQGDLETIAANCLERYTQWANGQVYAYSILDPNGDVIDSVGGWYDEEEMLAEAKSAIDAETVRPAKYAKSARSYHR